MMISTTAENIVIEKGMRSLINAMGVVDAERFLSIMNREKQNYDGWRENYFGEMTPEEYESALLDFEKSN